MTKSLRWPPPDLLSLERSLDELAESVRERPAHRTVDEQVWLVRFLVVRSCGYLEQVMHRCAMGHLQELSYGTARSYSLSWLSRSINPSVENIRTTLGRFDAGFVEEFELMLSEGNGELGNDLGALITKRHAIAHGQSDGLGDRRALDLYEMAKKLADWMIRRLSPDPGWGSSFSR
ncbi:HEPN domain-containing protein [Promicromonospora sp. NPDC052451]|uniref:HEPN domain-containing protein n=1 Tax=Promicromonospora sp. NPDC052451 TaxID=3364407 RepID=UPI0037C5C642